MKMKPERGKKVDHPRYAPTSATAEQGEFVSECLTDSDVRWCHYPPTRKQKRKFPKESDQNNRRPSTVANTIMVVLTYIARPHYVPSLLRHELADTLKQYVFDFKGA
jgi:hypothetical protein